MGLLNLARTGAQASREVPIKRAAISLQGWISQEKRQQVRAPSTVKVSNV